MFDHVITAAAVRSRQLRLAQRQRVVLESNQLNREEKAESKPEKMAISRTEHRLRCCTYQEYLVEKAGSKPEKMAISRTEHRLRCCTYQVYLVHQVFLVNLVQ